MKKVTDKYFWKTIKPNFTDKVLRDEKIILVEDDKVVTAETVFAKIKENTNSSACFSIHKVSSEDLLYQLNSLDPTKATQMYDIPTNIIKKNYDIFSEFLFANFHNITNITFSRRVEIR